MAKIVSLPQNTLPNSYGAFNTEWASLTAMISAHASPNRIAVYADGLQLTYAELERQSDHLAASLVASGMEKETLVGVCMERTPAMIVALLGILKAGGAYVPIDPGYPQARWELIVAESRLRYVLTCRSSNAQWERLAVRTSTRLLLFEDLFCMPGLPLPVIHPDQLAYVLHTSGSSGMPKGVMVSHANLIGLLRAYHHIAPLEHPIGSSLCPLSFDVAGWEIFSVLCFGGTLHLLELAKHGDPYQLARYLKHHAITSAYIPPTLLDSLIDQLDVLSGPCALRRLLVGVEPIPQGILQRYRDLVQNINIINGYGPTETTVCATFFVFDQAQNATQRTPIGSAAEGYQVYLLDKAMKTVANREIGEIYIGGVGVARGYMARPELTADRFVPDPFAACPGSRLYRTGDLARCLGDGQLEYISRNDTQVKVRGYRIEPGEVESALLANPAVSQAIVRVHEAQTGEKRLVAYVVPAAGQSLSGSALRRFVEGRLPAFMVPNPVMVLDYLPLTAHGKIDHAALPRPIMTRDADLAALEMPTTETEHVISAIWRGLLGLVQVGVNEDFFSLGGHSLLATQMLVRLRDSFQVDLLLPDVFLTPTIRTLGAQIDQLREKHSSIQRLIAPARKSDRPLPLSFSQERVWFIQQLYPDSNAYHFQATLECVGVLNIAALEQSLTRLIERHEIFRTTYPSIHGQPAQIIHPAWTACVPITDLTALSASERDQRVQQLIDHELHQPFDINQLPLIRWRLLRITADRHILIHVEHHLLHDGWSFTVFLREFLELYQAFDKGCPSELPPLEWQFADFAAWQRTWMEGLEAQAQLAYWCRQLAGAPALINLPADYPRPAIQTFRGAVHRIDLPDTLGVALKGFVKQTGATLFMVLFAAFDALLYRYTGQQDICVGTGVANRRWRETEQLIGMIVNNVVLRTQLSDRMTFSQLLDHVRAVTLEAYANQDLPFDKIVEAIQPQRGLSHNPIFQVAFSFHDNPMPDLHLEEADFRIVEGISNHSAKFDMNIVLIPRWQQRIGTTDATQTSTISLVWEYNTDLFSSQTVARMVAAYQRIIEALIAQPDTPIATIPLVSISAMYQQALPVSSTQSDECPYLHLLFEKQAVLHPTVPAVQAGNVLLTYEALNLRANHLAHILIGRGVRSDTPVAFMAERSVKSLIAMLAILKAGGAYLPLDPALPLDRLKFILDDAQPPVILVTADLIVRMPDTNSVVLCIDSGPLPANATTTNPINRSMPNSLAYILYTSGSSGKPKGVGCTHQSIVNLLQDVMERRAIQVGDRCSVWTSLGFDVSVYEVFSALTAGATACIVPEDIRADGINVARWLASTCIQSAFVPPFMVADMLRYLRQEGSMQLVLSRLLVGVEPIAQSLLADLAACIPGVKIINGYGPTETTICATLHDINSPSSDSRPSPIGRPVRNTWVHILDPRGYPVPPGVVGEVFIGGIGVARGYLNSPTQTAERFLPDPFSDSPGARLYRSGDLARLNNDGVLEFIGRADFQIKIRGFRVELGEIEAALKAHHCVREAVVLLNRDEQRQELIAYLEFAETFLPSSEQLVEALRTQLPDYMIPALFIPIKEFPKTVNGKIDRRDLPAPEAYRKADMYIAPSTPFERIIAEIWQDVLKCDSISANDNFFALGGHSLLGMRIISRISESLKIALPLQMVFVAPTVAQQATMLEQVVIDTLENLSDAEAQAMLETLAL